MSEVQQSDGGQEKGKHKKVRAKKTSTHIDMTPMAVSYTHLRAHETVLDLVCRLLLEKKKKQISQANK